MSESSKVNYSKVLIKGSLALSMAEMSVKVIGFLLLPIFTYYLSPKDFGIISIVFLITSTLNLLYNPGIISAVQRLYHSDNDLTSRQELIGSSYVFFISTPIIVLLTSIIFGDFIFSNIFDDFRFYPYGIAAIILSFFVQTKRLWVTLLTLTYEVKKIAIYTVISVFLGILVSLFLVVYLELGVMGRVLGAFPGSILLFIIGSREIIKFSKFRWSIVKLKYILKFGSPLIIGIFSYEFLHIADRFIIEQLLGLAALGIYTFSYTLSEAQKFVMIGLNQLFSPIFYENMNLKNYGIIKKILSAYIIVLTYINILIILFSNEIIILFINSRFLEAIKLIPLISAGLFFNGLLLVFTTSLSFKNKFGSISKIALIASVLNVVLNLLLIPYFGILAAAYSTLIAYFIYFLIGFFKEFKSIKIYLNLKVLIFSILILLASLLLVLNINSIEFNFFTFSLKLIYLLLFTFLLFYFKMLETSYFIKIYFQMIKYLKINK